MTKLFSLLICSTAAILGMALTSGAAFADPSSDYPTRPIKLIVPYPPGGPTDVSARILAKELAQVLKQPVFIDNKPGASTLIGTQVVKGAAADGYTLLYTANSGYVIPNLMRNPTPYDPVKDFSPISMVARYPLYVVMNPSVPVTDLPGFIDYAKKNPNKLNLASVGIGGMGHVACELLQIAADINLVHIPYKGAAPAAQGLLAGEAHIMCDSVSTSQPYVKDGRMKGLALMAEKRSPLVPDVPTTAEAGLPNLEVYVWNGMLAPANMPPAIIKKLSDAVNGVLKGAEFQRRMHAGGFEVMGGTPETLAKAIKQDQDLWGPVIKGKNIIAQ